MDTEPNQNEYNASLIRELCFWIQGYLAVNGDAPTPFHEHHVYALIAAENLLTDAAIREEGI